MAKVTKNNPITTFTWRRNGESLRVVYAGGRRRQLLAERVLRGETMLRIHFLQQWFNLSDPAMEDALYDMPLFQQFVGLDVGTNRLPDESTTLRFRHLLEANELSIRILAACR